MWIPAYVCSPMRNSTCSHFYCQPLKKGLDTAQCQSWLILWFLARPFPVLQTDVPPLDSCLISPLEHSIFLPASRSFQAGSSYAATPLPLQCTGHTHIRTFLLTSPVQPPTHLWKPSPVPQHTACSAALVQPVCYPWFPKKQDKSRCTHVVVVESGLSAALNWRLDFKAG